MRVGSQVPRIEVLPAGRVEDAAREIAALGSVVGIDVKDWQSHISKAVTARRADGKFTCFEFGIEVPRQNGKTAVVELVMLWHLFLVPDTRVIVYSAHEFKTAQNTFRRIERLIRDSALAKFVPEHGFRYGNDDKSITTNDGSVIRFMARSSGAGRGFTGDLIVLDEAYDLSSDMVSAILPTLTTAKNPQIIYLSSAGFVNSTTLNGLRDRALGDDPGRLGWLEWSVPEGTDPEDIDSWYVANPMLGILFDEEYLWDELRSFRNDPEKGETQWLRERLGVRERVGGDYVIDPPHWQSLTVERPYSSPELFPQVALAVDVPPSRDSASIGLASWTPDGRVYVELVDRRDGVSWVPLALRDLKDRLGPRAIGLDEGAPAGGLVESLRREGRVRHTPVTLRKYAAACGRFFDLVQAGQLVHLGNADLQVAVEGARKTRRGETAWTWSRKDSMVDISPLVAVTIAASLLGAAPSDEPKKRSGRRVLVM